MKVFNQYLKAAIIETLAQDVAKFNAASAASIQLATQSIDGDFLQESFWVGIHSAQRRVDRYAELVGILQVTVFAWLHLLPAPSRWRVLIPPMLTASHHDQEMVNNVSLALQGEIMRAVVIAYIGEQTGARLGN
ncbi:hypothetical protein GCM10010975_13400 [Comamonas phosphati]|nr:hypothetical protein GCM10010975_13400 [Comamonas phosphati]